MAATAAAGADERMAGSGLLRRILLRPELGALIGALVILLFFTAQSDVFRSARGVANWLDPSSTYGIMAVAVALLMIAGEFDLSAGTMTGTTGLITGILTTHYGMYLWVAIPVSLLVALAIGFANGFLVVRTGLPSFIVTLGTFFMLQGLNLGITKLVLGNVQVSGVDEHLAGYGAAHAIFAEQVTIAGTQYYIAIAWWLLVTALATWVLLRTRFGNWIFASGGDPASARNVGVPAHRTKIILFMTTAAAAWFIGQITVIRGTSIAANVGIGEEFIYIIAAVTGGCLLTGGFGSAIGASLGALIFGMTSLGIVYLQWDSDWFKFFLGAMLLLAVLTNKLVRRYAEQSRGRAA